MILRRRSAGSTSSGVRTGRLRPVLIGLLLVAFVAGACSSTDSTESADGGLASASEAGSGTGASSGSGGSSDGNDASDGGVTAAGLADDASGDPASGADPDESGTPGAGGAEPNESSASVDPEPGEPGEPGEGAGNGQPSPTPIATTPAVDPTDIPETPDRNEQQAIANEEDDDESTAELANTATDEELNETDRAVIAAPTCASLADEVVAAYQEVLDRLGDAGRDDFVAVDQAYEAFGAGGRLIQDRANELGCTPDEFTAAVCTAVDSLESGGQAGDDLVGIVAAAC